MVFKAMLACPVKTSKDEPVVVVYVRPLSDCTGRLNNEDISKNSTFMYISVAVAVASKQLLLGITPVFWCEANFDYWYQSDTHFFLWIPTTKCIAITSLNPYSPFCNGHPKQDFLQTKFVVSFCRYILAIDATFCLVLLHLNEVEPHFRPLPSFSPSIHPSIQYARFLLHSGVKAHQQQL